MIHQVKGYQRVQRFKKLQPRLTTRDMLYIVTQHYTHTNTHTHTHTENKISQKLYLQCSLSLCKVNLNLY